MARTVLITGGAKGIGKVIARELAAKGMSVAIADLDEGPLRQVAKDFRDRGFEVLTAAADVSNKDDVKKLFEILQKNWGSLDILVNNAGICERGSLKLLTDHDYEKIMDVNVRGTFLCSRQAIKLMTKQKWGRIINMSSLISFLGGTFEITYAASKGAVNAFTKSLARDVGRHNITVNAICPARIGDTEILNDEQIFGEADYVDAFALVEDTMCPLVPRPAAVDIAKVVAFLASDDARAINGQLLHLDGGMY